MELNLSRQPVFIQETVLNTTAEQPVEGDLLLPDYCPDMVRILKCTVEPTITQAVAGGDKLLMDGVAVAHIYYKSEARQVCHASFKMPFSKSMELKNAGANPQVTVRPEMGYCNCRVVNQRRIDLRGAVNLHCKVVALREESLVGEAQGMGVCCRHKKMEGTKLLAQGSRPFTLRQDVELGAGKPPIASALRADMLPSQVEVKVIAGKLITKGEMTLHLLYLCEGEENHQEAVGLTLPVSQIFDVEGVEEGALCTVSYTVGDCEVQPKPDLDGEARMVSVEATLFANLSVYRTEEMDVITDGYSTKYDCRMQNRTLPFGKALPPVNDTITLKEQLELPEEVERIVHLWCKPYGCESGYEGGTMTLRGKVQVCLFGCDREGSMEYYDRSLDFSYKLETGCPCDWVESDLSVGLLSCGYTMAGVGAELTVLLSVTGTVLCCQKQQVLTDITVDEGHPIPRENSSCLTIYFSEMGESVWDIAKRYNTSPAMILEENALAEEELLGARMLLIPVL